MPHIHEARNSSGGRKAGGFHTLWSPAIPLQDREESRTDPRMPPNREIDSLTTCLDRDSHLIPEEVVAAQLTIQSLLSTHIRIIDIAIEILAVVFLVLPPFCSSGTPNARSRGCSSSWQFP